MAGSRLFQELEALSDSHYPPRRTASLVLPRTSHPSIPSPTNDNKNEVILDPKPRSRRMSLSSWRSKPKLEETDRAEDKQEGHRKWTTTDEPLSQHKKGIWNWKPIRALSHIGMQRLTCLFSVEVETVQRLPASMNGLRLSVCVRKKETRDGSVQTMPSRVSEGAADFDETLFIRSHVYFAPSTGTTRMRFEPRPFLIYAFAVDAQEMDFGRVTVDLSGLIQESIERSFDGARIRQWDNTFSLIGKAKGGELVLKLGIQIMEKDGGIGIYSQGGTETVNRKYSPTVARKQSKTSFSVPSPKTTSRSSKNPSQKPAQGIDELDLDELDSQPPPRKPDEGDNDPIPDFDVEEKGIEFEGENKIASEVVKEVVTMQDQSHLIRLSELDSIARQIKALESSVRDDEKGLMADEDTETQALDTEEDKVTRKFLLMLEDPKDRKFDSPKSNNEEGEKEVFVPDLGKGLGCVVQTRNRGYLAALNPFGTPLSRKDEPKLAMQMSKPLVTRSSVAGFEVMQRIAALGVDKLTSEVSTLMPMEELIGKTAEQIAFEGIASSIIQGRSKEGASSSAARTIAAVKSMATAMNIDRSERYSTGIWNVSDEPVVVSEILAASMQKIETMAVDALKIQAGIYDEDAPFDVSPLDDANPHLFASALPIDDWIERRDTSGVVEETITISMIIQMHDPLRQYETIGGPMIALIHATGSNIDKPDMYKVGSIQVGGIKVRSSKGKNMWDGEKQRLTALQWLVAYGMGKKSKRVDSKGPDVAWSISSRVMADMWLKHIRNPDVKLPQIK